MPSPSPAKTKSPKNGKAEKEKKKDVPSGLVLNNKNLFDFRLHAATHPNAEFVYLRDNEFQLFDPAMMLHNVKILDLSQNFLSGTIEFLPLLPNLRHLYLTGNAIEGFQGFQDLEELETLCISCNRISSFEGLGTLPNLRVLSVNNNVIPDFKFFPFLPSLYVLNLHGNPLCESENYRKLAIAVCNSRLHKIDNEVITPEELDATHMLRGKVAFCVTEGFVADDANENLLQQAAEFLLAKQKETTKNHSLSLQYINLQSTLREGDPVDLEVCLQDRRPLEERKQIKFHSNQIFPVELTVQGEAQQVFVVGSMNKWKEPLELDKCVEGSNTFFHTTLYLPPGEYEYRYVVDGEEKVSENMKTMSKHGQGVCNIYQVTECTHDVDPDTPTTLLHIRWLRSNIHSGFDLIEGVNSLKYTPSIDDIGSCLRAEVLSYVAGQFEALVFDITPPIVCSLPRCVHIELQGAPVEDETLRTVHAYNGGLEGPSIYQWFRVSPDGSETLLPLDQTAQSYVPTDDDVNCRLKVRYTPVRDDGVVGEPAEAISGVISAVAPKVQSMNVVGSFVEGEKLVIEYACRGSIENNARYRWFRQDATGNLTQIKSALDNKAYVPSADDVGCPLVAEFTPMNRTLMAGEAARFTTPPIIPGAPVIRAATLLGQCSEGTLLTLNIQYFGGQPGAHEIAWFRKPSDDPNTNQIPVHLDTPTSTTYLCKLEDVGHHIIAQITPVRQDGARGELYTVQTGEPIAVGKPGLASITFNMPYGLVEGKPITVEAHYIGGGEGNSIIEWYRSHGEAFELIRDATGKREFTPTVEDYGCKIRCVYTPVRTDGAQGAPQAAITGSPVEAAPPVVTGVDMVAEGRGYRGVFKYSGGYGGDHAHRWSRVDTNQIEVQVASSTGPTSYYRPTKTDEGCRLRYSIKPARVDGVEGDWVSSGLSAVIRVADDDESSTRSSAMNPAPPPAISPTRAPGAGPMASPKGGNVQVLVQGSPAPPPASPANRKTSPPPVVVNASSSFSSTAVGSGSGSGGVMKQVTKPITSPTNPQTPTATPKFGGAMGPRQAQQVTSNPQPWNPYGRSAGAPTNPFANMYATPQAPSTTAAFTGPMPTTAAPGAGLYGAGAGFGGNYGPRLGY